MKDNMIFKFEKGNCYSSDCDNFNLDSEWYEHKKFKGVYLKNILLSSDTNEKASYHLVKIEPNCEIGDHIHENSLETHEIIFGSGSLFMDNKRYDYNPGDILIIKENQNHKVIAGEDGLYLFAKFFPALV